MIYINRIVELQQTVRLVIPLFRDITVVYSDIIDGGHTDSVYSQEISGGAADSLLMNTIDGGNAQMTGGSSFESTHLLALTHTATKRYIDLPCKFVSKDKLYLTVDVTFRDIPFVGQYNCELLDNQTNECIYRGLLEIRPTIKPLVQHQNNEDIIQNQ